MSRFTLCVCAAVAGIVAPSASAAHAASIGINFVGSSGADGTLASTDVAGVVPQANFNNETGSSGGPVSLVNSLGAATTATLTYSANGSYSVQGGNATTNQPGNEALNAGFIYGNGTATVSSVPYASYNVYVYQLNDAAGRQETTSLNGATSYYGQAPNPGSTNYVDNNASTAYNYVRATSQTAGTFTNPADYTLFTNVTGSSFTITTSAPGNGYLNGIQIVQLPEPAGVMLSGLGALGLFVVARPRKL